MKFQIRKNIRLPKSNDNLLIYIRKHHLNLEDIAQNLVTRAHPNGIHAQWLRKLIKRGLSRDDATMIKKLVNKLSRQKEGHHNDA